MTSSRDDFEILNCGDDGVATYVFKNEDHTLGNSLRHVLMRNPDTEFCGYSVPHPSEASMQLRLQTRNGVPAKQLLQQGLSNLSLICSSLETKFDNALSQFEQIEKSKVSMVIDEVKTEITSSNRK